ncbi:DUF4157 domain-containing protein [Streptomyces afghaniensis]|uniref:DUF4157 domain-containing protein n=1 Tax=Streptomyces afghaniensis TaxID=66865 RepID=UPI0037D3D995
MTQDGTPPPTLGERLEAEGRLLAARLQAHLPWAGPLHLLMDRTAALAAGADRFERIDVPSDRPWPAAPAPAAPSDPRRPVPGSGAGGAPEPVRVGGARRPPGPTEPPRPPAPPPGAQPPEETGDPLPAPTRSRLRAAVGPAADALRAHHGASADALARSRRADAVTVGRDVYFRHGRLRPQDPRGFGLLVHEATHVLAVLRPGASWLRATGAGARAEEAAALRNEQATRAGAAPPPPAPPDPALPTGGPPDPSAPTFAPPVPSFAPPAVPPTPGTRSPTPPAGPAASPLSPAPAPAPSATMADAAAAAVPDARPLSAPADRDTTPAAGPPPLDVAALRRDVINDLMRQLRSESERGG